jgi:CRISPR-associated endonuclease/helicase Cas3
VGADFDFDLLVTEAAPLDSLLQRLGRLNRLGLRLAADAVVVHCPKYHAEDPVYGKATDRAWEWLVEQAGGAAEVRPSSAASDHVGAPSVDLSSRQLARLLAPEDRILYSAEPVLAPVVLGPVLDAWARTEPAPEPDQPVAPFLHGYGRGSPEVLVCWRAGLPPPEEAGAPEKWEAELRTTPVAAQETVSVPLWEAAGFLAGRDDRDLADVETAEQPEDELEERTPVHAMVLAADGSVRRIQRNRDLRPGATVVVAAEEGGHDEWGWTGRRDRGNPVRDVADLVRRRRLRLRLRPKLLDNVLPDIREEWSVYFERKGPEDDRPESVARRVLAAIMETKAEGEAEPVKALASTLAELGKKGRFSEVYPDCILVQSPLLTSGHSEAIRATDQEGDEEEGSSSTAARPVSLERHLCDVACRARDVAVRLGLAPDLVAAVELAGRAHDLGKADSRFQVMLNGGERLRYEARGEQLAKSNMDPADRQAFRKARERSGWPKGMRHEAISAALVRPLIEDHPEVLAGVDPELVVHLVATHHGWGRPLLPPVLDPEPELVTTALPGVQATLAVRSDEGLIDWDGPARFQRLCRRYGRWGLALLEATVRLADIACSEEYRS